ncbi:S1/P1 nuclease [Pedobacter fastidiosus]|uniref:S1/P1 nuclease n=1 Tax=Pedobacter fastidiosus TaxID=2765361 RepID=A0ABR7KSE0_9SPHI|nr:S1/P1 nuclease [Pedobacter fastidiosus]MBC6110874.1 S1/P1 nuclease [Pedobacter fastidiosus]
MKKYSIFFALLIISATLISWGFKGHKTVASIADRHLTPEAKLAVKDLLGDESIQEVSTWADEARNQPEYKNTGNWHFINLPLGLSKSDFKDSVKNLKVENLYQAYNNVIAQIEDPNLPKTKKVVALKFIIHLIGDAHQPMHISRAEDKGGNTIQVQFMGKGTNLHSLWDSKLIDYQNLTVEQMAENDSVSNRQIRKWQRAKPMQWIYESYQISSQIYASAPTGSILGEEYYKANIGIVNQRMEMAGIRLAGVLNKLFKHGISYPKEN